MNDKLENDKLPVENGDNATPETPETVHADEKTLDETPTPDKTEEAEAVESKIEESVAEEEPQKEEPAVEKEPVAEDEPATEDEPVTEEEVHESGEIDYDLDMEQEEEESDTDDQDENTEDDDSSGELPPIEELVPRLRALAQAAELQRKDVEELKNQFYRSLRNEIERQKNKFLEEGGESIDFVADESELYAEGKDLLQKIKEKRAEILAKEEAEKEANVIRKLNIIDQIKVLTENQSQEDFNKIYQEFKALQQQWNDIKLIPQAKANELWKSYQIYVEKFYDLVRINNEFREYDFKKNYELKTELCEAAERLDEEPDVVSAFHQLQNLHQQWREIGPVARKDRETIWLRFKEASTLINKKYQSHFEELKGKETENLDKKTALCEKLEAIDYEKIETVNDWRNKVKEVLDIQAEWRKIGYVPRKWNSKIYERYRTACDEFFRRKNDYYKSIREDMDENLKKKLELCQRAEAMKDSTDWRKTTQDMIAIQKEWKQIGLIPRKYVDSTWQRFISACDHFFEQKKLHTSSKFGDELKNLEAKKEVVDKINNIDPALPVEEALPLLKELMNEWHEIGYVPFKQKDKAYKDFYDATDAQFSRLNIDKADRKLENFKSNLSDMARSDNARGQILHERDRLMRQYERMKSELQTYENNIGFLSVSSKKGNSLVDDMNSKVKKLKADMELIVKKIEAIDKEL